MSAFDRTKKEDERLQQRLGAFYVYTEPDDPAEILLEIIAARCLGIKYGDPGPVLPSDACRQCWGDRHVWLGNVWGVEHTGGTMRGCKHECHQDEMWIA